MDAGLRLCVEMKIGQVQNHWKFRGVGLPLFADGRCRPTSFEMRSERVHKSTGSLCTEPGLCKKFELTHTCLNAVQRRSKGDHPLVVTRRRPVVTQGEASLTEHHLYPFVRRRGL